MKAKKTYVKKDIYQEITNKVIASIENGVMPWACGWNKEGDFSLPVNFSTGVNYRGINVMLLWMAQEIGGFSSPNWMTYNQAKAKGGMVRKGEKGTGFIFYKQVIKETEEINSNGDKKKEHYPMLKGFTVFNLDQIDGIDAPKKIVLGGGFSLLDEAENLLTASGVKFNFCGTLAFYRPSTDEITMPEKDRFKNARNYYATAFHELTHATKKSSRCDRKAFETTIKKGAYAFEEVVADLGAAFCMGSLGMHGTVENHAVYIAGWLSVLKNDKKAIFRASAQAQKAHEWIEGQIIEKQTAKAA